MKLGLISILNRSQSFQFTLCYVSKDKENIDEKLTWEKKSKNVFVIKLKDNDKTKLTAKFDKSGKLIVTNEDHEKTIFKRDNELNLDKFIGKDSENEDTDTTFAPAKKDDDNNEIKKNESTVPGDAGLFDLPSQMQGTWYSVVDGHENKMMIGQNTVSYVNSDGSSTLTLHTLKKDFDISNYMLKPDYQNQTKGWGRAGQMNYNGFNMINIHGWNQSAGAGEYLYWAQEKGQTVLVQGSGANAWTDAVYWKNQSDAQANVDAKFDNLLYQ